MSKVNLDSAQEAAQKAVEKIFEEKKEFIIIGLTGRTGCGCSTVADLLNKETFEDLQPQVDGSDEILDRHANKIIYDFAKKNWKPFHKIEMKHVIFTFILKYNCDRFLEYVKTKFRKDFCLDDIFKTKFDYLYNKYKKFNNDNVNSKQDNVKSTEEGNQSYEYYKAAYKFYFKDIPDFYKTEFQKKIIDISPSLYTSILQNIGNNIRASGDVYEQQTKSDCFLKLAEKTNGLIKILRKLNQKKLRIHLLLLMHFAIRMKQCFLRKGIPHFICLQ